MLNEHLTIIPLKFCNALQVKNMFLEFIHYLCIHLALLTSLIAPSAVTCPVSPVPRYHAPPAV